MIKKAVEDNYGIVVEGIVKISEKAYKIFANNQIYLLKRHQDEYIENVFVRLKMLGIVTRNDYHWKLFVFHVTKCLCFISLLRR